MLCAIMQQVAALTVGFEIARLVVARIVIDMGCREHDFRRKDPVIPISWRERQR
jgi:hypothetical protein